MGNVQHLADTQTHPQTPHDSAAGQRASPAECKPDAGYVRSGSYSRMP
jgi:hypothetical protein